MTQFMWIWNKFFFFFATFWKWKIFHFASLGSNLANAKVQNPKTKFRQSGKFSTKSGKISTSAECSNSCDFWIKIFFFENFSKIFLLGCNLANEKVQMPKKKFHQSGKFSTKSGKFSTSAECSNSCDFGIIFFFWKWKIFQLSGKNSTISIRDEVCRTCMSGRAKNFSAKVENFAPKVEILFDTPR